MKILAIFISMLFLVLSTTISSAEQIYQWVDEEGVTRISNVPTEFHDSSDVNVLSEEKTAPSSHPQEPYPQHSTHQRAIDPLRQIDAEERYFNRKRENLIHMHQRTISSLEFERQQRMDELDRMLNSGANRPDYKFQKKLRESANRQRQRVDEVTKRIDAERNRHRDELKTLDRSFSR